jgi:hypothetical protein
MLDQATAEALSCFTNEDIIDYLEEEGYSVNKGPLSMDELVEQAEEYAHIVVPNEGLYLTDKELGDIHMLAYSGQREEAIKEILALVVPAITMNTKVLS